MRSESFKKGDCGLYMVMLDLYKKGYEILSPVSEQLPFDLVAYNELTSKFIRIQVKYIKGRDGTVELKDGSWDARKKNQIPYKDNSFDFYAIYIPSKNIVIYPSFQLRGKKIRIEKPNLTSSYYWYKDFLNICPNLQDKRKIKAISKMKGNIYPNKHKVKHPNKEELAKLIWSQTISSIAKSFVVSDSTIIKWCKTYNIQRPGRGFWNKYKENKISLYPKAS